MKKLTKLVLSIIAILLAGCSSPLVTIHIDKSNVKLDQDVNK